MKRMAIGFAAFLVLAAAVDAQNPAQRVADDAMVVDRVVELSKKDLPRDLLQRMVNEDVELLRGRRADGSYDYATWERFEAGRIRSSHSIQPKADTMVTVEARGSWVYRIIVEVPARRMIVRKNNQVWIERVDVDFVGEGATQTQQQSFEVKAWLQPGEVRPIDLPVIARQLSVKVIAATAPKTGYANLDVALVQARIVDKPDSPYAEAVISARSLQRTLEKGDLPSIRAAAQRLRSSLTAKLPPQETFRPPVTPAPAPAGSQVTVTAADTASRLEMQAELQLIEDLLTGSEAERREGLDRLHQLIRRMRAQ